jgi:hypothetical protein
MFIPPEKYLKGTFENSEWNKHQFRTYGTQFRCVWKLENVKVRRAVIEGGV